MSDMALKYFRKGAQIEISSEEDVFNGAWFEGRVIRPPKGDSNNVAVEYATLFEDGLNLPLRGIVNLLHVRPPPPRENRIAFKFDDHVDAYYNNGWRDGYILQVMGIDKYMVFFYRTKEQVPFKASQLRKHRDWDDQTDTWDPPLEELPNPTPTKDLPFKASQLTKHRHWDDRTEKWDLPLEDLPNPTPTKDKVPFSAKVGAKRDAIEHQFSSGEEDEVDNQFSPGEQDEVNSQLSPGERDEVDNQFGPGEQVDVDYQLSPGEQVEVRFDDEGFEGAWFEATVLEKITGGKYLIEYTNLKNDDGTDSLREEVDGLHMRPQPPDIGLVDRFALNEEVDAWYNDGWWVGTISKVLKVERYTVYFKTSDEELKFDHSKLRVHQDWKNGKWYIASKVVHS